MQSWRTKLLFVLIVYFMGFATAIYVVVPGSRDLAEVQGRENAPRGVRRFTASILKEAPGSSKLALSFRAGIDKCLDFGRDAGSRVNGLLKKEFDRGNE